MSTASPDRIRFGRAAVRAEWSSADQRWTVDVPSTPTPARPRRTPRAFVISAAGYYNYEQAIGRTSRARSDFAGPIVHPQHWPEDLDYAGKRVVVIGSGATAVTLVPAMADDAAHVTMLQRSPTYVISLPAR